MASTNYDSNVRQLTNIADIYGLHQLISEPTRITDRSSTLIDLIFTNCPERVVCSGVAHISISDHSLVYAFRKLSINFRKGHSSITYRNFKTFNRAKFRNDIYNENWEFLGSALNPNQMWAEWKIKFLQIVDKHAPIRTKRIRSKNSPWITADLKERMHNRDRLVYVIAWSRGQLRINFTSIFKVCTKLPESRSDKGNLENFENTSEINP